MAQVLTQLDLPTPLDTIYQAPPGECYRCCYPMISSTVEPLWIPLQKLDDWTQRKRCVIFTNLCTASTFRFFTVYGSALRPESADAYASWANIEKATRVLAWQP